MFQTEWPVLIVDDDPDVIAVSKLAMKNFIIDGVPIKLFAASSKAEAVELLSGPLGGAALPYISVAFIDVVMEFDQAGLDLCRHIRETMMNRLTQIYIRTGQPGIAPEREVIDRYEISTGTFESGDDRGQARIRWSRRASGSSISSAWPPRTPSDRAGDGRFGIWWWKTYSAPSASCSASTPLDLQGAANRLNVFHVQWVCSKGIARQAATTARLRPLPSGRLIRLGLRPQPRTATPTLRKGNTTLSRRRRPTGTATYGTSAVSQVFRAPAIQWSS